MSTVAMKSSVCITSQEDQDTHKIQQSWVSSTSPASSNSSLSDEDITKTQCDSDEDEDIGVVFIARRVRVTQVKGRLVRVQR
ncbi:hypothetical protein PC9H_008111 [Pleurotus ostreatus]|uniref:Uncharacterized protein n=1 Tax=Pleurotus ostreatus TaxID=5322 RepID=A0A8H6ZVG6_PLEOS|nr:uncharacterized protein PC9H_008111 [Pleurotus ostreatus]KAF7428879.1 hypothetical protein PC9H_008111 [Pleurotus ostreatus]